MLLEKSFGTVVLAVGMVVSTASTIQASEDSVAGKRTQDALAKLAKGGAEWKSFSVTYDDLHALHGGLTLTIHGTGKVAQKAVPAHLSRIFNIDRTGRLQ